MSVKEDPGIFTVLLPSLVPLAVTPAPVKSIDVAALVKDVPAFLIVKEEPPPPPPLTVLYVILPSEPLTND